MPSESMPDLPPPAQLRGPRIGDLLLAGGLVSQEQLDHAVAEQTVRRRRLGEILREDGVIDDAVLAAALGVQLDVPLVDLRERTSDDEALALLREDDARRLVVLPLTADATTLTFATEDPGDQALVDEVARLTHRAATPLLALRSEIENAIAQRYRVTGRIAAQVSAFSTQHVAVPALQARSRAGALDELRGAPVIQIVNLLVTQALRDRASDLHIEPQARGVRIRARIDGVLRDVGDLPADIGPGLVSRIKILADLNIVEKQRAQDGQITMEIEGRPVDIRVATMRTLWGEKVVLRLLDRSASFRRLDQLGFPAAVYPRYRSG
jgi:type IV pilus assembly protein PilB